MEQVETGCRRALPVVLAAVLAALVGAAALVPLLATPAAAGVDTTAPACDTAFVDGPPIVATTAVQDPGSGLAAIIVTVSENADTVVPAFTPGTTDPVQVTSTQIDPTDPISVSMTVSDQAGNTTVCVFSRAPQDDDPPTCAAAVVAGPPQQATFTVQDTTSGLAEILVTESANADTVVPPFLVGTDDPVVATSTKIDQTQPMSITIRLTDLDGNQRLCTLQVPNALPTVSVTLTPDPASVTEPGAPVDFEVVVTNTSTEPVVITALEESAVGDLSGEGTCTDAVGTQLAPTDEYTCTYTDDVTGAGGVTVVRTVTVTVEDLDAADAAAATDSASATVAVLAGPTTTTTSTTTSTTSTSGAPATTSTTATVGAGALSRTGADPYPLTTAAGALLAGGGAVLLASSRRPRRAG